MQMVIYGKMLNDADQFVLDHMLGLIGQGHGHVRVRGIVSAVKYIRLQYGLDLKEAKVVVEAYESSVKAKQEQVVA